MAKQQIRFGIIGCGLMGREFASAAARWCHLTGHDAVPKIVGICDANAGALGWFEENFGGIKIATADYRELLASPEIDAIYCAVPHNLHKQIYCDIIRAGKHLMAEKPFGIDRDANREILAEVRAHPEVLVRCSSEFPFYPGAQRIIHDIAEERFGQIIEVHAGFLHSSDLDPRKPINWKRLVATNGAYGCMGDLGLHVLHVPLRAGWVPTNVRGLLSKIVTERPGPGGTMVPCETWDNAILACEVSTKGQSGPAPSHSPVQNFPMILETKRIAPGETNTWFIRILGTKFSAEFSTKQPKTLRTLAYTPGAPQAWQSEDLGSVSAYPTITGGIFEFGFSDSIVQMWAAFCDEIVNRDSLRQPFYCATPEETALHHDVLTAALLSHERGTVVRLADLDGDERP